MRRAELRRNMEIQQQQINVATLIARFSDTAVGKRLKNIPMVMAAFDTAGGAFVKVKGYNPLVGKSIDLAMNISTSVMDKIAPLAEKGITAAAPITGKVDEIAAKSLDGLIARVPVINEQPNEIVENTKKGIDSYTKAALSIWPVQSALDVYEHILTAACNTMDTVLPPAKDEQKNGDLGASTKESLGEQEKHRRGYVLAQRTYSMVATAFKRVFGICQTQVGNAANATDMMYKSVKNAVTDSSSSPTSASSTATPASSSEPNSVNNGDANKSKKNKNKKNNQEQ